MAQEQNNPSCCNLCLKRIIRHEKTIKCSFGNHFSHVNCLPLYSPSDIAYARNNDSHWSCPSCLSSIFPFNNIEENEIFENIINNGTLLQLDPNQVSQLIYDPFGDLEEEDEGGLDDIDPDQNFLSELGGNIISNCKYHYIDTLHSTITPDHKNIDMALMHLNIRSVHKNFGNFIPFLHTSEIKFDYIALTETWLCTDNADSYGIPGFHHEYLTRSNKVGGGVSIFVRDNLIYKTRPDLSEINSTIEMLWIEIDRKSTNSNSNTLIGVIYRPPGTDPKDFNKILNETLDKIILEKNLR